jgi:antirestriction protein ArdC
MATDYVDQVATAIIKQLKEGTAPWQKPWQPA